MREYTDKAITALIAADDTIKEGAAVAALALLRGTKSEAGAADKLLTRAECAKLLRVSCVTVTRWGDEGILKRVRLRGRRKSAGYSLNSVNEILKGKTDAA